MNDNELRELTEARMALAGAISGAPEQIAEASAKYSALVMRLLDNQEAGTGAKK